MNRRNRSDPEGPAARRWREIVERRARQMDAAYASLGRTSSDYWSRRMTNRANQLRRLAAGDDPFLQLVLSCATPDSSILDVGAGAGRYTVALAAHARALTAVEPDEAMIPLLRESVEQAGLGAAGDKTPPYKVEIVRSTWEQAEVAPADLAVCAHVLYPIAAAEPFLRKLDEHASVACFVALRDTAPEPEPLGRLWQRYYGEPRLLQPGYADAFDLLYEMGIRANVRVYPAPGQTRRFESIEQALAGVREHLILPEETPSDADLLAELGPALLESEGLFVLPAEPTHIAALWWTKGDAGRHSFA